jgi:hypothetical protein
MHATMKGYLSLRRKKAIRPDWPSHEHTRRGEPEEDTGAIAWQPLITAPTSP